MNEIDRQRAIEDIKQAKARYLRGVDTADAELVRSILADDCVLDYRRCCTDPATGRDFLPGMNIVLRGKDSWSAQGLAKSGIVSVHQAYNFDIVFTGDTVADVTCAMTDRLFMPPDAAFSAMMGYGYYHETWEDCGTGWKLKALRISRLRVAAD